MVLDAAATAGGLMVVDPFTAEYRLPAYAWEDLLINVPSTQNCAICLCVFMLEILLWIPAHGMERALAVCLRQELNGYGL